MGFNSGFKGLRLSDNWRWPR